MKFYILSIVLYVSKTWTLRKTNQTSLENFSVWCWRRVEKIIRRVHVKTENVLHGSFVYWNGHHIDSWVKRDQLHVTCFIISLFNAQHVSDVNTSILRSLRLMCWVISLVVLIWFDEWCCCCVVVWLWWCGIRMQVDAPPQPNHNATTTTHIEPDQYNPWINSAHKSQAPEDGCINIRNMLSIK